MARHLRTIDVVQAKEAAPVRDRTRQRGFTLVEGLVVVGIIGMIALIAGVQITNFVNKANLEGAGGEVRSFLESAKTTMVRESSRVTVRYQVVNGRPTLLLVTTTGATLRTLTLPDYVKPAVNPGGSAPAAWPAPAAGDLFTCDTQGRTLSATGAQVTGVQMVSLTHKGMVDADGYRDVRPRMRYDIELYPLWTVRLTKRTF
jgi:prepilin-type N-terminal cleavage/methylation domain-containing protein